MNTSFRLFIKPKIMFFAVGIRNADYFSCLFVNDNLHFYCVSLFLAGIPSFLPLFGRSTGDSVASI